MSKESDLEAMNAKAVHYAESEVFKLGKQEGVLTRGMANKDNAIAKHLKEIEEILERKLELRKDREALAARRRLIDDAADYFRRDTNFRSEDRDTRMREEISEYTGVTTFLT